MVEENYFFRLSAYADRLLEHYEAHPEAVEPETRRNEVLSPIRGGLQDFSISRTTFDWGIPLPWDPKHVCYVWFDALTNYITAAGYADDPERFARMWPANIHSIGKDILRFHAIYWPAMLMAGNVEPPTQVWAHGFLTVGGKKMSKTNATGIHPFELLDVFGVDSYRYYFMREIQFGQDGSFSWEAMVERHNADLANGLGNLASRVLAMLASNFDGVGPRVHGRRAPSPTCPSVTADAAGALPGRTCRTSSSPRPSRPRGRSSPEPTTTWSRRSPGRSRTRRAATSSASILYASAETLRILAVLIFPIMPRAAERLWSQLGIAEPLEDQRLPDAAEWGGLAAGTRTTKGESLFPRLETDRSQAEGRPGAATLRSGAASGEHRASPRDVRPPSDTIPAPVGGETSQLRVSREAPPIHPKLRLGIVAAR